VQLRIKCSQEVRGVFADEYVTIEVGEYDVTDLEAVFEKSQRSTNTLRGELYLISARSELGRSALVSAKALEELKSNDHIIVF
jgi:hypothetical protein